MERFTLPDMEMTYQAIVIDTVWYWHRFKETNGTELVGTYRCGNLMYYSGSVETNE